jgi:hypothetical protein
LPPNPGSGSATYAILLLGCEFSEALRVELGEGSQKVCDAVPVEQYLYPWRCVAVAGNGSQLYRFVVLGGPRVLPSVASHDRKLIVWDLCGDDGAAP